MKKECIFLKNLDKLQNTFGQNKKMEGMADVLADQVEGTKINHEARLERSLDLITAMLGLYIEHELSTCIFEEHIKEEEFKG